MSQHKGGIDECISHGIISHGTIQNPFGRETPAPPPEQYHYWVDDDGKYFFSENDEFFVSIQPI
jgi:hypothetical protein